jgi:hypothetical protein
MKGLLEDLSGKPPNDRVLDLARLSPELQARGLPGDLYERDLSDGGLAKMQASLNPAPKRQPTVWEEGLVPPKSRAWRPPIVPPLNERQMEELNRTDRILGLPPGLSQRQLKTEDGGPGVRSHAGAMGRAQVLPKTLDRLNADRQKRGLRPWDADNDDDAIAIHREVMRQNMDHFKDPGAALAAYNGGWNPANWNNAETRRYYEAGMGKPFPPGLGLHPPKR